MCTLRLSMKNNLLSIFLILDNVLLLFILYIIIIYISKKVFIDNSLVIDTNFNAFLIQFYNINK